MCFSHYYFVLLLSLQLKVVFALVNSCVGLVLELLHIGVCVKCQEVHSASTA